MPPALAAPVPLKVAASLTAVLGGTLMVAPLDPPPERVVETLVALCVPPVTVSTSAVHEETEGALLESPP